MVRSSSTASHFLVLPLLAGACGKAAEPKLAFDAAFPDASVLVTTSDPEAVRARLDDVVLPDTTAHRERLLALLRSREQMHAAHLLLLVRAVPLRGTTSAVARSTRRWTYGVRGRGDAAKLIDQLLTEGLDRIADIQPETFGELIGYTQSDATMRRYCERFLTMLDDGSTTVLAQILEGMPGSPALSAFLREHLLPSGRLAGERGWVVFANVQFDGDRSVVLQQLVEQGATIDGARLLEVLRKFSFDDGRRFALELLLPKVQERTFELAREVAATFAMDSGRQAAIAALGSLPELVLSDAELLAFARSRVFDGDKLACVKALVGRLQGPADGAAARDLLASFSFDDDRLHTVEVLASRWATLATADRQRLLATFTFDSQRAAARAILRD